MEILEQPNRRNREPKIDKNIVNANIMLVDENKELKLILQKIKDIVENENASGIEARLMIKDLLEMVRNDSN